MRLVSILATISIITVNLNIVQFPHSKSSSRTLVTRIKILFFVFIKLSSLLKTPFFYARPAYRAAGITPARFPDVHHIKVKKQFKSRAHARLRSHMSLLEICLQMEKTNVIGKGIYTAVLLMSLDYFLPSFPGYTVYWIIALSTLATILIIIIKSLLVFAIRRIRFQCIEDRKHAIACHPSISLVFTLSKGSRLTDTGSMIETGATNFGDIVGELDQANITSEGHPIQYFSCVVRRNISDMVPWFFQVPSLRFFHHNFTVCIAKM